MELHCSILRASIGGEWERKLEPRSCYKFNHSWTDWVDHMFSQNKKKWEKLGLIGAILSSKSDMPFNQSLISTFLVFWSHTSNCFLLSEGPMSWVTLSDVYHILNVPLDDDVILPNFTNSSRSSFNYSSKSSYFSYTSFLAWEMGKLDSEVSFLEECSFYLY